MIEWVSTSKKKEEGDTGYRFLYKTLHNHVTLEWVRYLLVQVYPFGEKFLGFHPDKNDITSTVISTTNDSSAQWQDFLSNDTNKPLSTW